MLNKHVTSKAEIAKELNLSMPTVLANVNDLLEKMVLEETGESPLQSQVTYPSLLREFLAVYKINSVGDLL